MSVTTIPTRHEFLQAARSHFRFLETEFDLPEQAQPEVETGNPFQVRYSNEAVLVIVEGYDWGYSASVQLGPIHNPIGSVDPAIPFWTVMKLRRPDLLNACRGAVGQLAQLRAYAAALRECAADVLSGDLTVLSAAAKVLEEFVASMRAQEEQQDFEATSAHASEAFWNRDYVSVLRLLERFAPQLTPVQLKAVEYSKRHILKR